MVASWRWAWARESAATACASACTPPPGLDPHGGEHGAGCRRVDDVRLPPRGRDAVQAPRGGARRGRSRCPTPNNCPCSFSPEESACASSPHAALAESAERADDGAAEEDKGRGVCALRRRAHPPAAAVRHLLRHSSPLPETRRRAHRPPPPPPPPLAAAAPTAAALTPVRRDLGVVREDEARARWRPGTGAGCEWQGR